MRKLSLEELKRISVEDYKSSEKLPVTIVLDNIRSALNVGSIFRTVDGFALERIILCGITAKPPHKEINKSAIGATNSVEWTHSESVVESIRQLKSEDYLIIGIEQVTNAKSLNQFSFPVNSKIAIIFGNEVEGISADLLPLIDIALEVAQYGTKHSFNVAVCAGIILWEASRQLRV